MFMITITEYDPKTGKSKPKSYLPVPKEFGEIEEVRYDRVHRDLVIDFDDYNNRWSIPIRFMRSFTIERV